MTGGTSMPPVDARASMDAATIGRYPTLFISGMVKTPTAVTLATWLPVMHRTAAPEDGCLGRTAPVLSEKAEPHVDEKGAGARYEQERSRR